MRKLIAAALTGVALAFAPAAHADPNCVNPFGCNQEPWPGQLLPTWNTPGYYGGWTTGPVLCSPFNLQCRGVAPQ